MSIYFEIAYACAAKRLCLFTGTGFSKAITDNQIPSWQGLLEGICDQYETTKAYKDILFPKDKPNPLNLDEAAQVIALELNKQGLDIHEEIANLLRTIPITGSYPKIKRFFSEENFRIITTNYDKLAEQLVGDSCLSLCPGQPIPRSTDRVKTYHVHGSIDSPTKMVVTAEDYFNFMSCETYFSRKLSTILHENTVIIMGYSLGDTNLKAILNNYRTFVKTHHISNNIIFVAKGTVEQCIVDYYATCYGIRVIQKTEIETFFQNLDKEKENAEEIYRASIDSFRSVFTKAHEYEESFLKKKISFYSIISSIAAEGKSLNDPHVVSQLDKIINIKQRLAGENGAWDQYVELASWLCYLGTILDVRGTQLENTFCSAVAFSMNKMRRERKLGYSWDAYKVWANDWQNMRIDNRLLIKTMNKEELEDFAEKFIKQAV